jgi:hydrogenase maturation protease
MNEEVRRIADAVLFEGYLLYPYRPSSVKNRQRWTFGGLFPKSYPSDPSAFQAQMLIAGHEPASITVTIRFLHLLARQTPQGRWQEAMERDVTLNAPGVQTFTLAGSNDGAIRQERVDGIARVILQSIAEQLYRLTIQVENCTSFDQPGATRDQASMHALIAAHAVAEVAGARFISLTDPPLEYREAARDCANTGVWPVLAGEEGSHSYVLASPIILPDYPQIAPESPGDLFDGAEIDEILTLRILTLTESEKTEMRAADSRARSLLERTELLSPEDLLRLHGVLRNPHAMENAR